MLYRFLSRFLVDVFNARTYSRFCSLAAQDAAAGARAGSECLFRFFSAALGRRWNADLYADFEQEVLQVLLAAPFAPAGWKIGALHGLLDARLIFTLSTARYCLSCVLRSALEYLAGS